MPAPLSDREATIHYVDASGRAIARRRVSLGSLAQQCRRGNCQTGRTPHSQTCPVAQGQRCSKVTPEAWGKYLRLDELDRLGR